MDGRFEGNKIYVDLEVRSPNPLLNESSRKISVILDTGCTGDLILTYADAFPLALTLVGLEEYTIADGSRVKFFECIGIVRFGDKSIFCTVSIRPSGSPLMGISLLKKIGYVIEIDFIKNTVIFKKENANLTSITKLSDFPDKKAETK